MTLPVVIHGFREIGLSDPEDPLRDYAADLERLRHDIAHASLGDPSVHLNQNGSSYSLHLKFPVSFGEDQTSFQIHVMKDGEWHVGSMKAVILLTSIPAIGRLCNLALNASVPNYSHVSLEGQKRFQEELMKRAVSSLKERLYRELGKDVSEANARLVASVRSALSNPSLRESVVRVWEDAVRTDVQKALVGIKNVSPELMHRLIDEIYAAEVHES